MDDDYVTQLLGVANIELTKIIVTIIIILKLIVDSLPLIEELSIFSKEHEY